MFESILKLSTSVIAEVDVVTTNIEVTDDVDTSMEHDEEEKEEAVDRDDDIEDGEDEVSVNSSGSISAKKGRPADTLETLRRKCRARCKDISALKQEVDVLQKELTSLKEKPIGQCLYDLVERAGNWKEPSRMRKIDRSMKIDIRTKNLQNTFKYNVD